jgi:hypothetical protein
VASTPDDVLQGYHERLDLFGRQRTAGEGDLGSEDPDGFSLWSWTLVPRWVGPGHPDGCLRHPPNGLAAETAQACSSPNMVARSTASARVETPSLR